MISSMANEITHELENNLVDFSSIKIKNIIQNKATDNLKIKVFENEVVDIYIIIWNVDAISKIHNHAKNGCWLKVLKGCIKENRYDTTLKYIKSTWLEENNLSFIHNMNGYHNIENCGDEIAITLHIYSPSGHNTIYF